MPTIKGTDNADVLVGGSESEVLLGLGGNDHLMGGVGSVFDDILIGGGSGDVLDGGDGFDFASYATATDKSTFFGVMFIDLTRDRTGDAFGDIYISIEGVIGSSLNDFIIGRSDVDEALIGGAGNDIIFGKAAITPRSTKAARIP